MPENRIPRSIRILPTVWEMAQCAGKAKGSAGAWIEQAVIDKYKRETEGASARDTLIRDMAAIILDGARFGDEHNNLGKSIHLFDRMVCEEGK